MQPFPFYNSLPVSVIITPSNGNTLASYIFPSQQELFGKKIIAIESYCAIDCSVDPNNAGYRPLPITIFRAAFLTLYTSVTADPAQAPSTQQPGLFYDRTPFPSLRRLSNYGADSEGVFASGINSGMFQIRPSFLAFNKCKVEFPTPIDISAQGLISAVFTFYYLDDGDDGKRFLV